MTKGKPMYMVLPFGLMILVVLVQITLLDCFLNEGTIRHWAGTVVAVGSVLNFVIVAFAINIFVHKARKSGPDTK